MKKLELPTHAVLLKWLEKVPSSQRFWVLTGSIALITGVLAMQLIYNPAALKHERILARLQEEEQRLETLRGIASSEKELKRLSLQVIQEGDAQTMIQRVTQLASQSGLTLLSAKPNLFPSTELYRQVHVDVAARGTFQTLRAFLSTLQNQQPYLEVSRLEVARAADPREAEAEGGGPSGFYPPDRTAEGGDLLSRLNTEEIEIQTTVEGWTRKPSAAP